jgi:hypothetical protein
MVSAQESDVIPWCAIHLNTNMSYFSSLMAITVPTSRCQHFWDPTSIANSHTHPTQQVIATYPVGPAGMPPVSSQKSCHSLCALMHWCNVWSTDSSKMLKTNHLSLEQNLMSLERSFFSVILMGNFLQYQKGG